MSRFDGWTSMVGAAIMAPDAAARQIAEDKITARMIAARAMFCPRCGAVLDMKTVAWCEGTTGELLPKTLFCSRCPDYADVAEKLRPIVSGACGRLILAATLYPKPRKPRALCFPLPCPWCGKSVAVPEGHSAKASATTCYTDGTTRPAQAMHDACRIAARAGQRRPIGALGPAVPFTVEANDA